MNSFSGITGFGVSGKNINPAFNNSLYENTGLSFQGYTGSYYGGSTTAFNGRPIITKVRNLQTIATAFTGTGIGTGGEDFNGQWTGYFKSDYTGYWYFYLNTDNWTNFWIGDNAISNYTAATRQLVDDFNISNGENNVRVTLQSGRYYPIRIQFGEDYGDQFFNFYFNRNGTTIRDSTNYLYSVKSGVPNLRGNPAVFI